MGGAWTGLKNNSDLGKILETEAGRLADELNMRGKKEWRDCECESCGFHQSSRWMVVAFMKRMGASLCD